MDLTKPIRTAKMCPSCGSRLWAKEVLFGPEDKPKGEDLRQVLKVSYCVKPGCGHRETKVNQSATTRFREHGMGAVAKRVKTEHYVVRADPELINKIHAKAKAADLKPSEFVRRALAAQVRHIDPANPHNLPPAVANALKLLAAKRGVTPAGVVERLVVNAQMGTITVDDSAKHPGFVDLTRGETLPELVPVSLRLPEWAVDLLKKRAAVAGIDFAEYTRKFIAYHLIRVAGATAKED